MVQNVLRFPILAVICWSRFGDSR